MRLADLQVASIPNLVIVERATGKAVTTAGRDAIDADPDGKQFPWIPPTVSELAQGPVTTAAGEQSDFASVSRGKVTGIYFSAHWCPPCRKFTPHLVEFYKQLRGTDREFEVVFASRCAASLLLRLTARCVCGRQWQAAQTQAY